MSFASWRLPACEAFHKLDVMNDSPGSRFVECKKKRTHFATSEGANGMGAFHIATPIQTREERPIRRMRNTSVTPAPANNA